MPDRAEGSRKGRWSNDDIRVFDKAWNDLMGKTPGIDEEVARFNAKSTYGWKAGFEPERFHWGLLRGVIPAVDQRRAQIPVGIPPWLKRALYSPLQIVEVPAVFVYLDWTDSEAHEFAAFAQELGNKYDLDVKRTPSRIEQWGRGIQSYTLRPKFDKFI